MKTESTRFVQLDRALEVVAERLLDDDPAPAVVLVVVGHAGAPHLPEDDVEHRRRDRQIERGVAANAVRGAEIVEGAIELVERVVVIEGSGNELDVAVEPLPHLLTPRGARVFLGRRLGQVLEVAVAPVAAGESEQDEVGRQQAAIGQVVDRRQQLLAREVAGHPEDHQRARLGYPRQPPVARIAQRVEQLRRRSG